jgi:hypothetical protein
MVATLLVSLNDFWKMDEPFSQLLLYAAVAVSFGWVIWRKPWVAGLLLLCGVAVSVWAYNSQPYWNSYAHAVAGESLTLWASFRQFQFATTFAPILGNLFLIGSAALGGLLIVPESLGRGNAFWSITCGLLVLGSEWAWYFENSGAHFAVYGVLGFMLWVLAQAGLRDARWEKAGRKIGYRSHVATPIVWVLAVAMVATILPDHFAPIDLGTWGDRLQKTFPMLRQLRGTGGGTGGSRFSLASTGFSPTLNSLGGPVKPDNTPALTVAVDQPLAETLYLRGATFRTYTGHNWESGDPETVPVPADGYLPIYRAADALKTDFTARITYNTNLGYAVFNLLEPRRADGLRSTLREDADQNTWADRAVARNAPYNLAAWVPRYSAEQIRLLSTSAPDEKYQPYLQLPNTQLNRVQGLTRIITARQQHPYDKAVALESYLRSLTYALDVPAAPSEQDFVDYFLFNLKRGYCVYSASALAVMLRQAEIPSRLVEGFAVPAAASYTRTGDGKYSYVVAKAQAHAWVEAYFAGYGWITLDPTPRSDLPAIDRSVPAPVAPSVTSTAPDAPFGGATGDQQSMKEKPDAPEPVIAGSPARKAEEWSWGLAAALALLGLLALAYRRLQSQEQVSSAAARQVVQEVWVKTSSLLGEFGVGRRPDQTPREYARTLGEKWPALKDPAAQVAEDYTAARYSPPGRPADDEAPGRAKAFWQKVEETLFNRFGWRVYLWRRLTWRSK